MDVMCIGFKFGFLKAIKLKVNVTSVVNEVHYRNFNNNNA